ncbi:MAG: PKD domain-containing protein [Saprospiraceae bacterium]|nr:PKD domain-containing protein [Saprospiraceae bacterium]
MKHSPLLFFLLFLATFSSAQGTYGTTFWCAFMENLDLAFNGPPTFVFQIDAITATDGVIEVPATGLSIPFTANAASVTSIELPAALWYSEGSEFIDSKGIRITTDEPVYINAVHFRLFFTESTRLLTEAELGSEYIVSCYSDFDGSSPSEFVIVSTADNNEIEIIPTTFTFGLQQPGVPFTVVLDEGESFQVKAIGDLTGTQITSLSGIDLAVFSGAQQANIGPCTGGADSHVYDQAQPVDQWTDLYHFVPFFNQGADPVLILAAEDNTDVFFDCELVAMLDAGESFSTTISQPTIVSATGPISMAQFNSSQDCNPSGFGDPNMLQLFPANRQLSSIRVFCPEGPPNSGANYIAVHYINIALETSGISGIALDGFSIAGQFSPFPGDPLYSYAQIPLTPGEHFISSLVPFNGIQYGFGDYDGYTSNLGYQEINQVDLLCLDIEVEGLFCIDSLLSFSVSSAISILGYDWDFGDNQQSNLANPEISYSNPGVYTVTLTVVFSDGTFGSTSLEIEIFDCPEEPCVLDPELQIAYTGQPCTGLEFSFSPALSFASYSWDFGDGGVSSLANPSYTYLTQGIYTVTLVVIDQYNCQFSTSLEIEVPDCMDPCLGAGDITIFFDGTPCVDSVLTFYTSAVFDPNNPPFTIEWTFSSGDVFLFEESVDLSFSMPGIYTVTFTAFSFPSCDYFGTLEFEIFDDCGDPCINPPNLDISWSGETCIDSLITFYAETSAPLVDYFWEFSNGPTSTDPSISIVFLEEGTYELSLTVTDSDGCTYEEVISLIIKNCDPCKFEPFAIAVLYVGELCAGSEIEFTSTGFLNPATFSWDFGDSGTSIEDDPTYIYENAGSYTIILTGLTFEGCTFYGSTQIEIAPCLDPCLFPYEVAISSEGSLCVDSILTLSAETDIPDPDIFEWTIGTNAPVSGTPLVYLLTEPGNLFVALQVTDTSGCSWDAQLELEIDLCVASEPCNLFFPNAFSPNDDGLNETFGVFYNCRPEDYRLLVFNRWGGLVFESDDPDIRWDGKIGDKPASSDVFAWRAVYTLEGISEEVSGDLLLIR